MKMEKRYFMSLSRMFSILFSYFFKYHKKKIKCITFKKNENKKNRKQKKEKIQRQCSFIAFFIELNVFKILHKIFYIRLI